MLLQSVRITTFRCIADSNTFGIDPKVTCLVGKNESGKTAILQALTKLNSVDQSIGDFTELDYPRHGLSEYKQRAKTEPATALVTTWKITDADLPALSEVVGSIAEKIETVTIYKGYDNKINIDFALDEKQVVRHLLEKHGLMQDEYKQLEDAKDVKELQVRLAKVADPSQRQKTLLDGIEAKFGDKSAHQILAAVIRKRIPKFAYFSEYLRMPGQLSLDELKKRITNPEKLTGGDKVFLALLEMIGRSVDDLEKMKQFEPLIAELEAASNRLTREIFQYWTQNRHLKVQFRFEPGSAGDAPPFNAGFVLRTRIENLRHGVSTSFDQRSAGFVWFFSFLVWFNQIKKTYGENVVILLDEPGLSLHAKAQADLLRYIEEKLVPNHQVIYTTHSPFMIDAKNLLRARTVEDRFIEPKEGVPAPDECDLGTKVGHDVLSTDRDTIFPLQACLGYEITQTLFVGPHTLLVEGPGDILYLQWFQQKLSALGRTALDKRWTIAPCGGIDKIAAFLNLFAGNKLHVAVFSDFAQGNKKKLRDLRESQLLQAGHVLTAEAYAGKSEADVEDLLGDSCYPDLINQCYKLPKDKQVPLLKNDDGPASARVVKRVEEHFKTLPASVEEFDHYKPTLHLWGGGLDSKLSDLDGALDRFERLFKDLNALLPKK